MPQRKTIKWDYDSVKAHHAKYRDSVLVDATYDVETGFKNIYIAKGEDYDGGLRNTEYDSISHEAQYYIVPGFISIITAVMIFAFVLLRDNEQALKQKRKDSVLNMMSKK